MKTSIGTINPVLHLGAFVVVETYEGDAFIGVVHATDHGPVLRSGFAGHPKPLYTDEIAQITPVVQHPDVEFLAGV